jgi:N-carbamoyl-L-amino-acid hydrolase
LNQQLFAPSKDAPAATKLACAGMIFVPCRDGISHNEIEDATAEQMPAGGNALLLAMLERAGVA